MATHVRGTIDVRPTQCSWEGIVEAVAYIPFTFTATRRA